MKKFLSVILSISLLSGQTTCTFAQETTNTDNQIEQEYLIVNGMLPYMWNGAKKFCNGTSGLINKVTGTIEQFGQLGYRLNGISYGLSAIAALGLAGKNFYEKIKLRRSKINQDVGKVVTNLDKELQCIKGQEKAKNKMKEVVASIIDARNEAKENDKPYGKGDVIYINGPSGVGKTFSAECLARAIMGSKSEPIRIDSSCFNKTSEVSLKDQILYMREQQKNNGSMNFYYVDNSLAAKIASNPNIVLIFDEYDKWCTPETDELLRTIMDKGVIYRDSEKIDCSGLLVLVLSNEDHSSVSAGNGMGVFEDDGTGSRTHVVHDKSFLNRLQVIEFDNLYEDDYAEITQDQLKVIADRYKKLYFVDFDFGNIARKIAIKVARLNQGAREIAKILGGLKTAIIIEKQKLGDSFKDKDFKVFYSPSRDEFVLKEKNGNTNLDEDIFEVEEKALDEMQSQVEVRPDDANLDTVKNLPEENNSELENQAVNENNALTKINTESANLDTVKNLPEENNSELENQAVNENNGLTIINTAPVNLELG